MKEPVPHETHSIDVHVAEPGAREVKDFVRCEIDRNIDFSTDSLASYFFAQWRPEAYDALLVAAAVEFADRSRRRSTMRWDRDVRLRIPVHDVDLWRQASVSEALKDALDYLTGDSWAISFYARKRKAVRPEQSSFELPIDVEAVIPFSNGLDSRAVAGLKAQSLGQRLVRIRLSSKLQDSEGLKGRHLAFTKIPYEVKGDLVESSARSRGFKFAVISGIAAFLSGAHTIIVPESGQGALGPSLVPVGQTYEDYRSHPTYTRKMERFFKALFGRDIQFEFPQLWKTKAETLKAFIDECGDSSWTGTRSCWQQNRQVGVDGKRRQCGICAACMLRRMSIHAAGALEPREHYVWERLNVSTFEKGATAQFPEHLFTDKLRDYAIAGTLHLDHLAALRRASESRQLEIPAYRLANALNMERTAVRRNLQRLVTKHAEEWSSFVQSLGPRSFIADWAVEASS